MPSQKHIPTNHNWHFLAHMERLTTEGRLVIRIQNRQIILAITPQGPKAFQNQCPHQGYPLLKGKISENCQLTCPWHNWKFDLETGECLTGGDELPIYPIEIHDDQIWVNLSPLDPLTLSIKSRDQIHQAFTTNDYERLSREIARYLISHQDPIQLFKWAIDWSWTKLQRGWTHAYAGLSDWLLMYHNTTNSTDALICFQEALEATCCAL